MQPLSADIVDRAMHTDLKADFIQAAERMHHKPAGPYLAVNAAIEAAIYEWRWDNGQPDADISTEQRDSIFGELTNRCWKAYEETPRPVSIDAAFDRFCAANDYRRDIAI